MNIKFEINGLDCANCATELERAIKKIDGVKNVTISFIAQRMELEYDESRKEEILTKLKKVIRKEEPDVLFKEL